jgi:hypothetical protein
VKRDQSLRFSRFRAMVAGQYRWRAAAQQHHGGGLMTRAKKSFRLELTKEQQALVLEKIGMEAKELELTVDELERRTDPKQVGNQP